MRNKKYWEDRIGIKWTNLLQNILRDPYMDKLMNFLEVEYAVHDILPSKMEDVFKTFKLLSFDEIKCVLIVDAAYSFNQYYNGLPFSEKFANTYRNENLAKIEECINHEYGLTIDFDYSLEHLPEQGVLMLNSALSARNDNYLEHIKPWNKFLNTVIDIIVKNLIGVPVIIWGEGSKIHIPKFKNQIVFSWEEPQKAVQEKRDWKCPNFKDVDNVIFKKNGSQYIINWAENPNFR